MFITKAKHIAIVAALQDSIESLAEDKAFHVADGQELRRIIQGLDFRVAQLEADARQDASELRRARRDAETYSRAGKRLLLGYVLLAVGILAYAAWTGNAVLLTVLGWAPMAATALAGLIVASLVVTWAATAAGMARRIIGRG